MASVEKDAKERAKRRRENKVLADGNCQSFHFSIARVICARKSKEVSMLMSEDIKIPSGWVHDGPEAVGRGQAETSLFPVPTGASRESDTALSQPPQSDLSKAHGWM